MPDSFIFTEKVFFAKPVVFSAALFLLKGGITPNIAPSKQFGSFNVSQFMIMLELAGSTSLCGKEIKNITSDKYKQKNTEADSKMTSQIIGSKNPLNTLTQMLPSFRGPADYLLFPVTLVNIGASALLMLAEFALFSLAAITAAPLRNALKTANNPNDLAKKIGWSLLAVVATPLSYVFSLAAFALASVKSVLNTVSDLCVLAGREFINRFTLMRDETNYASLKACTKSLAKHVVILGVIAGLIALTVLTGGLGLVGAAGLVGAGKIALTAAVTGAVVVPAVATLAKLEKDFLKGREEQKKTISEVELVDKRKATPVVRPPAKPSLSSSAAHSQSDTVVRRPLVTAPDQIQLQEIPSVAPSTTIEKKGGSTHSMNKLGLVLDTNSSPSPSKVEQTPPPSPTSTLTQVQALIRQFEALNTEGKTATPKQETENTKDSPRPPFRSSH